MVLVAGIANAQDADGPRCAFDYNQDGALDGADYMIFLGHYSTRSLEADVNYSGEVDHYDLGAFESYLFLEEVCPWKLDLVIDNVINALDELRWWALARGGHPASDLDSNGLIDMHDLDQFLIFQGGEYKY